MRGTWRWLSGGDPSAAESDSESCQGCGAAIAPEHRHVVDLQSRAFVCVCVRCWVVLPSAAHSSYRAIPERRARPAGSMLSEREWDDIEIPVGIAFFFRNSTLDTVVVCYPSPAGPVESQLALGDAAWARWLVPDVEALLVRRTHRASNSLVVPIDVAYELVGCVRRSWSGFGGRGDVDGVIDDFFDGLQRDAEAAII